MNANRPRPGSARLSRRAVVVGLSAGAVTLSSPNQARALSADILGALNAAEFGVRPGAPEDQGLELQRAIDASSASRKPLFLPPGRYTASGLSLRPGTHLIGLSGDTVLVYGGQGSFFRGAAANSLRLDGLTFTGEGRGFSEGTTALIDLLASRAVSITDCRFVSSAGHAILLRECSGNITGCQFAGIADVGVRSLDALGLVIRDNDIFDCGNAGVHVWRSEEGRDGTQVTRNRIARISSRSGGTGQNGNGINVFRADNVQVADNRIVDVAFSAVRGNAASNLQITGNLCSRHGETALYSEFGFQGAVIANNIVDDAALGISMANLVDDGRLATCTGNLIRNLKKELPYDDDGFRYGTGIFCEGDTTITGNVVQNAPGFGLLLGWGPYLKNVTATGNVIRGAGIGINLSIADGAGPAVIADNIFAEIVGEAIAGYRWQERATEDLLGGAENPLPWVTVRGNQLAQ